MTSFKSAFGKPNAILYYADFLSLLETSTPVTDNCKYYFIHNLPVNSSYMLGFDPNYDKESKYIKKALLEYDRIADKFGEDAALEYIKKICDLSAYGCINAELMLKFIHRFSTKLERSQSFSDYHKWKKNQKYTHKVINDNGDIEERECTRYVYNAEKCRKQYPIQKSTRIYDMCAEETTETN